MYSLTVSLVQSDIKKEKLKKQINTNVVGQKRGWIKRSEAFK